MPPVPGSPNALVTLEAVRAAAAQLAGVHTVTPLQHSASLSELCGREVLFKCEQLQRTGSFKFRGAFNHIASLDPSVRQVVAASAGNHAQGVALAARLAGREAVIYMPAAASIPKVDATRGYGAEVRLVGDSVDDALDAAAAFARESDAHLVPPFDDPLVIAGQGTVGLEIGEQAAGRAPAVVVVPVGGGGLLAGVAAALRGQPGARPGPPGRPRRAHRGLPRIVGVEAEGAAAMKASLAAGHPVRLDGVRTIADGLAVKAPSSLTLAHAEALVDDVVTVSDEEIARALVLLLERTKAVVEPAGAVGLAALLAGTVGASPGGTGPAVVVLSGGNVDPLVLTRLIEHGLSSAGRFLRLRLVVDDRPGALAAVTQAVAELGLNVLGVDHHRAGVQVGVDEVEVLLTLETRDAAHGRTAMAALETFCRSVDPL
jgi:threonine dehydratase